MTKPAAVVPGVWRVNYWTGLKAYAWCAIKAPTAAAAEAKFRATDTHGCEVIGVAPFTEAMRHGLAAA